MYDDASQNLHIHINIHTYIYSYLFSYFIGGIYFNLYWIIIYWPLGLPDKSSLILLFRKDGLDHSLNFEGQEDWFHSKNTHKIWIWEGISSNPKGRTTVCDPFLIKGRVQTRLRALPDKCLKIQMFLGLGKTIIEAKWAFERWYFWLVLKLEISYYRVIISWRILVSFLKDCFEDYIFCMVKYLSFHHNSLLP